MSGAPPDSRIQRGAAFAIAQTVSNRGSFSDDASGACLETSWLEIAVSFSLERLESMDASEREIGLQILSLLPPYGRVPKEVALNSLEALSRLLNSSKAELRECCISALSSLKAHISDITPVCAVLHSTFSPGNASVALPQP